MTVQFGQVAYCTYDSIVIAEISMPRVTSL